jgi:cytochrome c-type biogenesis protein CcmH/NrfG
LTKNMKNKEKNKEARMMGAWSRCFRVLLVLVLGISAVVVGKYYDFESLEQYIVPNHDPFQEGFERRSLVLVLDALGLANR